MTTPNLTRLNNRIKMLIGRSINYDVKANYRYGAHFREYNRLELEYLFAVSGFKAIDIKYANFDYPDQKNIVKLINDIFGFIFPPLQGNIVVIAKKI